MKVAACQVDAGLDEAQRRASLAGLLATAAGAGARFAVVPEMAVGGYDLAATAADPHAALVRSRDGLAWLADQAARHQLVVATAVLAGDAGDLCDLAVVLDGSGTLGSARKRLLWAGEREIFRPGDEPGLVVDTAVGRIGVAVCYEAGFPETVRDLALRGAEFVAVPAAFGLPREHAWDLLTRSRALENGVHLVAAGLTGSTGGVDFAGHSRVVGPRGEIRAEVTAGAGVAVAVADLTELALARAEIPYLHDLSQM